MLTTGDVLLSLSELPHGARLTLWGAGETGREFSRLLKRERPDVSVRRLVDTYRQGEWNGLPIVHPDHVDADDYIVVTSTFWNEIVGGSAIRRAADAKVLANSLIHRSSHLRNLGSFGFSPGEGTMLKPRIDAVRAKLRDHRDREAFDAVVALRTLAQETPFLNFAAERSAESGRDFSSLSKYASNIDLSDVQYVIEGGVFDGTDTFELVDAIDKRGNLSKLYAFDPFLEPLKAGPFSERIDHRLSFIEAALWERDGEMKFNVDLENPANSVVVTNATNSGSKSVPSISIDSFLGERSEPLDLLKLDVEGAEMSVLRGARESIATYRPKLAISMYHRKEDLLEIPELLLSIHPDYQLSLSVNGATFVDMVLYAE